MANKHGKVVNVETFSGRGKDGKIRKEGSVLTCEDGFRFKVLNPSGKGAKYAKELKERKRYTNSGDVKTGKSGKEQRLSDTQAAYRSGYLQAQKDSARAFKAKKK